MSSTVSKYNPVEAAIWKQEEPYYLSNQLILRVPYKALATLLSEVEKTTER